MRLQHVRLGGRLYTTERWLEEFGQRLANADIEHFEIAHDGIIEGTPPSVAGRRGAWPSKVPPRSGQDRREHVLKELGEEGL